MLPVARAAQPGAIVGVVTNAAKLPVARVTVTALRADGEAIRATVSGSAPIFYQWSKDGNPIPGANSASLTITNAQLSNTGTYSLSELGNSTSVAKLETPMST